MIGRVVHSGMHAQVLNGLVAEVRPEWNATHAELTDWVENRPPLLTALLKLGRSQNPRPR